MFCLYPQSDYPDPREIPPLVVVVSGSPDEICIKISDRGGGMGQAELANIWNYGYSTAAVVSESIGTVLTNCKT